MLKNYFYLFLIISLVGCTNAMKKNMKLEQNAKIETTEVIEKQKEKITENKNLGPQPTKKIIQNRQTRVADKKSPQSKLLEKFFDKNKDQFVYMNFRDVDINAIAQIFSLATNTNIIVGKEVDSQARLRLENVPVKNAFDALLSSQSLYQVLSDEGNIITIHTPEEAVKLAKSGVGKIARSTQEDVTDIFRIHYANLEDLKTSLEDIFKEDSENSEKKLKISIDTRTKSLIVSTNEENMKIVSSFIEKLDKKTNVVLIEAIIILAKDNFAEALGARLGLTKNANILTSGLGGTSTSSASGEAALTTVGGTATQLGVGDAAGSITNTLPSAVNSGIGLITGIGDMTRLKLEIAALESETLSRTLSNPRIFTMDNEAAKISQGDQIPYTNTTSQDGATVQFVDAALSLEVTPSVVGDGNVILNIKLNNDSADTSLSNPPISRTEITTNLLVETGQIVVIGGTTVDTKSQTNAKVPFLGDIPLLGNFFKGVSNSDNMTELMIFISPVIL